MKFKVKNSKRNNIATLARKIGYQCISRSKDEKEKKFVRVLGRGGYPRFHLFLKNDLTDNELLFSLHLDQKKPIYKEAHDHAAEYDSKVVKREAQRITNVLEKRLK